MQKRLVSLVLALALMLTAFAGCGSDTGSSSSAASGSSAAGSSESSTSSAAESSSTSADGEQTLVRMNIGSEPDSLDPWQSAASDTEAIMHNVFEGLCLYDENGEIIPGLAERWDISEDGLTYTFHINPDAKFSDGTDITAEDVEWSYEYVRDQCDNWSWLYKTLDDVEAVDEKTAVFHFSAADASRLATMTSIQYGSVRSKAAMEKYGDDYGKTAESVVSSGPYVITDWKENEYVKFEARDDYYGDKPDLTHLKYVPVSDVNAAVVALQTGELDLYFNPLSGVALDTVKTADNVAISEALSCRNESVYMNCESEVFSDVRMRRAVAYAINKEEALEVCGNGQGKVVTYPCDLGEQVTGNPDFVPSHTYEYNVEKARALVEECGNVGKTVTIKSYNTEPYQTLSVWLQGSLSAIGLDAKVDTMERSAFLDQLINGEVEICPFSWSDISFDFGSAVGIYMNSNCIGMSGNYGRYNNPRADELIALGNSASDVEARKGYYRELIEIYMEDVPSVAMYAVINAIAHSNQLVMEDANIYQMARVHWAQ